MKIKNISTSIITISDLPGQQTGQGLVLQPGAEVMIFDEDAERSAQLGSLMTQGLITKLSGDEPGDLGPASDVSFPLSIANGGTGASAAAAARTNLGAADDAAVVKLSGLQTIADVKTFSAAPVVPDSSFTLAKVTGLQSGLDSKAPLASPTFTGTVSGVTKGMVGLGSVDNTADAAKPVSTAQQTALNLKAPLASPTFTGTVAGVTKAMVGLGSVDDTSDATKPISTAQQAALDGKLSIVGSAFIHAKWSVDQAITLAAFDLTPDVTVRQKGITLAAGVFTLPALTAQEIADGVHYELRAHLSETFAGVGSGRTVFGWVDTANALLANGTQGHQVPATSTTHRSSSDTAYATIAPSVSTQVKLRTQDSGDSGVVEAAKSHVSIRKMR